MAMVEVHKNKVYVSFKSTVPTIHSPLVLLQSCWQLADVRSSYSITKKGANEHLLFPQWSKPSSLFSHASPFNTGEWQVVLEKISNFEILLDDLHKKKYQQLCCAEGDNIVSAPYLFKAELLQKSRWDDGTPLKKE